MKKYSYSLLGMMLLVLTGCQVLSGERTVNQYSSDAAITANVKAELLNDSRVTSLPIHVDTDKGVVTLTGFVKTTEQKLAAAQAAKIAKHAKIVRNEINIRR